MVTKVTADQVFLHVLPPSPVSIIPPMPHTYYNLSTAATKTIASEKVVKQNTHVLSQSNTRLIGELKCQQKNAIQLKANFATFF